MSSPEKFSTVGKVRRRIDAAAKVTGQDVYADDISMPRMLHCKLLRSHLPHALIKNIDVSKAKKQDGVRLILTGKDFYHEYGILPVSQNERPLCNEKVRFVGDPVATVIARDELTAQEALELIDVEYEQLSTISDMHEGLSNPEVRVHNYSEEGNIHKRLSYEFGDAEEALANSDHVFDDTFMFLGNTHMPMEQHAAVAALKSNEEDMGLYTMVEYPMSALRTPCYF